MRHLLTLLMLIAGIALPLRAADLLPAGEYDRPVVERRLDSKPLHVIEGIWQFTTDGATVVIERDTGSGSTFNQATRYRMVIMRSPVRSIMPGTLMGTLAPTAKRGIYSATLYTDSDGGSRLLKPKKFTLTLTDDSRLSFRRNGMKLHMRLWRLLPYLSRLGIYTTTDRSGEDLDGCVRIYPAPVNGPVEPRYL